MALDSLSMVCLEALVRRQGGMTGRPVLHPFLISFRSVA
jgi:hypothetical protein